MSLLPQQMLPYTESIGTVQGDKVFPDKNFWLLLYNLCQQVLTASGATVEEIADLAYFRPKGTDYDRQIANLMALIVQTPSPAGRIAALEKRITDLETAFYTERN